MQDYEKAKLYTKKTGEFYWNLTKERISAEIKSAIKPLKIITALAVTSTVIVGCALSLTIIRHLK